MRFRSGHYRSGPFAIVPRFAWLPTATNDGYRVWLRRWYAIRWTSDENDTSSPRNFIPSFSNDWNTVWRSSTREGADAALQSIRHRYKELNGCSVSIGMIVQHLGGIP